MEKESILGKMAEDTKENITTIKNMDLESIFGLMAEDTKESGDTANSNHNQFFLNHPINHTIITLYLSL